MDSSVKCYSTPSVGDFGKYKKEEQCRRYEAEGSDYDAPFTYPYNLSYIFQMVKSRALKIVPIDQKLNFA